MTVTRTNNSISAPITGTNLLSGLRTAMQNAGFGARIDDYTSGNETRDVYEVQFSTSTYGTAYFETRVNTTTLVISCALYWSFNTTTNTGSASPTVSSNNMTINTTSGVNFVALDGGAQFKMVLIIQGATVGALSLLRPSLARPAFWTDADYPYFFMGKNITGTSQFTAWESTGGASLHPYSSVAVGLRPINLQGTLPNGQRQVVGCVQMQSTTGTNQGFIGQFNGDIVQVAGTNAIILDPITVLPGVEEYTILHVANGGLAVRTV